MLFHFNKFTIFGVAAAGLAAGIYMLWKPSKKVKRKVKEKVLCAGLENTGNMCFVNAVLQALSSCPTVTQWLTRFLENQADGILYNPLYLASTLLKIVEALNNKSVDVKDSYSATELLNDLRRRHWMISPDEQDAHEFFHVVMETLDEEATKYPKVISLFDTKSLENPDNQYQPDACAKTRSCSLLPVLPQRYTDSPFKGLLASQLKCTKCSYQHPVKYDLFDSLSLTIPSTTWGSVRLTDLLAHFVMSEPVVDVDCPGCAKIQGCVKGQPMPRTKFMKKTTLAKLPQCLCLHIQRTLWLDNGTPMKGYNRVIFPEALNMDEYAYIKMTRSNSTGLCGGNTANRPRSLTWRSRHQTRPEDLSPPMNLLRALNFQSQSPSNGFFLQSATAAAMATPSIYTDINQNSPNIPGKSDYQFKLAASVCHYGDVFSGHFVTCRRAPSLSGVLNTRWAYTSDTRVKAVNLAEVLNGADVYMLFYERL